ncbi:MAG: TonB-dependent receptor [Acidobacteriia bacterium]|nr:TonB-dependent receptor [Terriglobia bacterium]
MTIPMWVCSRKTLQFFGGCLGVLLLSLSAFSQANSGRISGSITDQSGAVITGATVTVRDPERGTTRTLTTDDAGAYSAPNLTPGSYVVKVEYQGFKSVERQNIVLEVGKEVRVDLALQPGDQAQMITVTESIPLVETSNAVLGGTLQPGTIQDLPLNGRNFMNLLQLRPGVTVYIGGGAWTQSTNGLRPEHNVYILDGITAMEPLGGQSTINSVSLAGDAATLLPVDSIQEFNTQQNPKAEFGWKPGSITNIGLKSGTNTLHGTANAFGRTSALDATNHFLIGSTDANGNPLHQQIALENFGATAGGPIKKDKAFFFLGYEGQRYSVGNPGTMQYPVESTTVAPGDRANNIIAACQSVLLNSTLSPTSLKLAGLNPDCTVNTAPGAYSIFNLDPNIYARNGGAACPSCLAGSLNTNFSTDNGLAKVDYHLSDKNIINGKMFIGHDSGLVANSATIIQPYWRPSVQAYALFLGAQWSYIPSSSVVNTFRFGSNYFSQQFNTSDCSNQANGQPNYGIAFGFGGPNNDTKPNCGMTNITLQGFSSSPGCCSSFPKFYGPDHINEFIENVSILHGKHSYKLGGEIRLSTLTNTGTFNRGRGQVQFRGTLSNPVDGDTALENFMRGNTAASASSALGQIFIGEPRRYISEQAYSLFFQDDYRVTQRLMLNLGVRYEYVTPVQEKFNRLANFDPGLGLQQLGLQTSKMWNGDYNNFSPRLGIAWDVRGNGKTVVRAGANLIYATPALWDQMFQQNTKDPTTGLNGNASGYSTCNLAGVCSPGVGNITSSGIVLGRAPLVGSGPTARPAQTAAEGLVAGLVNWNTSGALYNGNIYPGQVDAAAVFTCTPTKPCTIQATDQNLKVPYVTAWSLGIQHSFTNNLSLQLDYVGNHGTGLIGMQYTNTPLAGAGFCLNPDGTPYSAAQLAAFTLTSANCPNGFSTLATTPYPGNTKPSATAITHSRPLYTKYPYYSYIYTVGNPDHSNYNGMQATLTQRAIHGLSYTLGFTWAHALDMDTNGERGGPNNTPYNFGSDYSNSGFDIRKRLTATITYELPSKKGFAHLMEGWKVTSIVTVQNGLPWGAAGDSGIDLTGQAENVDRWNFSGNPHDFSAFGTTSIPFFPGQSNPACVAKAASLQTLTTYGCYAVGNSVMTPPALGTYGNLRRNFFFGNTFSAWDGSVIKETKIGERFSAEFRFEIFNVLNHTNFGNPTFNGGGNTDPFTPSSGFGNSSSTPDVANNNPALGSGGPREFQLGLRLSF